MTYLRHKGVVHLQCFQEDWPEPGPHHFKGNEHIPWNDGQWSAGLPHLAPAACREWWGGVDVGGTGIRRQWGWSALEEGREHTCTVGNKYPWSTALTPASTRVAALMVKNCLQDDGSKQFSVSVAVTIRATWWLDSDMAAVDRSSSF